MKKSLRLKALLTLLVGLFLSIGAFAQQIAVKGHVKDTTVSLSSVLTYW